MSKTNPVDISIHAVSPLSIFSAAGSAGFASAGGVSAAKSRPPTRMSRMRASPTGRKRFKEVTSSAARIGARSKTGGEDRLAVEPRLAATVVPQAAQLLDER